MTNKRVTMQDIANACGLSRNTVSKAFNGRGHVPAATRALILQKAGELGYGLPQGAQASRLLSSGTSIALLTHNMPEDYHVGTYLVTTFTDQVSRSGYTLKMFEISAEERRQRILPPHFNPEQTAGIVGIELFDPDYLKMICSLGLPTVIIDNPPLAGRELMPCDFVTMENVASVTAIIRRLASLGVRRIGFLGDKEHCGSFYERWVGFQIGLREAGLPLDENLCILAPDDSPYQDTGWLLGRLTAMRRLPEAFVCANDYLAIHLMAALKKKGLSIPRDIMVTGFDGTVQSSLSEPPLSTVQIPSVEIGRLAADILLSRIRSPELPFSWTHVRTTPVWRGSTR